MPQLRSGHTYFRAVVLKSVCCAARCGLTYQNVRKLVRLRLTASQLACCSDITCSCVSTLAHFISLSQGYLICSCFATTLQGKLAVAAGIMTIFKDKSELEDHLTGINPNYDRYAEVLWGNQVTSASQLGDASVSTLRACGVESALHAENIMARSAVGECYLLASGHLFNWKALDSLLSFSNEDNDSSTVKFGVELTSTDMLALA